MYDSTSGNVWKYRELLEKALVERGVFAHLGKFPVKAELGVTSAKQFTEQVEALFTHWCNDALFDKRSLDGFKIEFYGHLDKDQNKPEADARTSTKRKLSIDEEDEALQTVTGMKSVSDVIDDPIPRDMDIETPNIINPINPINPQQRTNIDQQVTASVSRPQRRRPKALDFSDEE